MPSKPSSPAEGGQSGRAATVPFFFSSFAWNVALGMTVILVPLYARSLGMSGVEIGTLVALPVVLQIGFTLVGGALTDRAGGKNMAMAASILTCLASVTFMASAGFAMMFAGQVLMVVARAIFWPATWALASELPGDPARQFGRLNSVTNAGQIAGTAAAGFLIAQAGYRFGFGVMAAASFAALLSNQAYRVAAAARRASTDSVFAIYGKLFRKRTIRYGMLCAYISSLPIALGFSFYPILLVEQGFDSNVTGSLMSLRAVGAIAAGMVAGYLLRGTRGIGTPLASASQVGLTVALGAAMSHPAVIGAFLFLLGAGSAVMVLYVQMLVGQVSAKEVRGSAMALINAGWGVSLFMTPMMMGVINDWLGIRVAFYIVGGLTLACGLALVPLQRWAMKEEAGLSAAEGSAR